MDIKERQALDSFEKMPLDMHAVVVLLVQSSFYITLQYLQKLSRNLLRLRQTYYLAPNF